MGAATRIFNGEAGDSSGIITAVGTTAFSQLVFLLSADGVGLQIYFQGS